MTDSSDQELVQLCLNGENKVFDVLVERYNVQMHRTACAIVNNVDLAKDITQNGFIKAWQKLDTYNSEYKFYSWLYRIIVNESLNFPSKRKGS
jgi:RNA polymerase sigma-70 factor (ECF subfamily)